MTAAILPHIRTSDNKLTLTLTSGQVEIDTGQEFQIRGVRYNTSDFSSGDRQLSTSSNTTYHLRFSASGTSINSHTPTAGTFYLIDVTDGDYNPDSDEEHEFNSIPTDMLIARIWTDGSNNLSMLQEANKDVQNVLSARIGINPNLVYNPVFHWWQRGTSGFSSTGAYAADRWYFTTDGASYSVARSTNVPAVPGVQYSMHFSGNMDDGDETIFHQRYPSEEALFLIGQQITVDWSIRADWASSQGQYGLRIAAPTAADDWSSGEQTQDEITLVDFPVEDSWIRLQHTLTVPSTIGGNNVSDGFAIQLVYKQSGGSTVAVNFRVAAVKIEMGEIATGLGFVDLPNDLVRCLGYFRKTFPRGTAPAQNAGLSGSLHLIADDEGVFGFDWRFDSPMRASPSVTTYNPSAANSSARNTDGGGSDVAVSIGEFSTASVLINQASASVSNASDRIRLHVTADAELT